MKDLSLSFLNRRNEWTAITIEDNAPPADVAKAINSADTVTCWSADVANLYRSKLVSLGFQYESAVVVKSTGKTGSRFTKIAPAVKVDHLSILAAL